jgi:hypothetical protein
MATKHYKQTFKGRPSIDEIHDEVGRRGGVLLRLDQSASGMVAYFEADDRAAGDRNEQQGKLEEVTMNDVLKM